MDDVNPNALIISLIASAALYAAVYYFYIGQWCPAMWFGTAPPIFILISTSYIYKILNRIGKTNLYTSDPEKDDEEMREFYKRNPSLKDRNQKRNRNRY